MENSLVVVNSSHDGSQQSYRDLRNIFFLVPKLRWFLITDFYGKWKHPIRVPRIMRINMFLNLCGINLFQTDVMLPSSSKSLEIEKD